jgi:cytochrome c peroxidase
MTSGSGGGPGVRLLPAVVAVASAVAVALVLGGPWPEAPAAQDRQPVREPGRPVAVDTGEPVIALVRGPEVDPARVALGARLFADPRLSGDGKVACTTCHHLDAGGDDGRPRSIGIDGRESRRNAPSAFNAAFNFRQYWDGRAPSLKEQVDGPLLGASEMGATWPALLAVLERDPGYIAAFRAIDPAGITPAAVRDALAEFQRSLVGTSAPFDRWLLGDLAALDDAAREGWRLFKALGCATCHQGLGIGGNMLQRMGMFGAYRGASPGDGPPDRGRMEVTGDEADRDVFKVPSLRNVALTAPYFHDGSVATLDDAVRVMARRQLGREIAEHEVARLVAFLRSLTSPEHAAPGHPADEGRS